MLGTMTLQDAARAASGNWQKFSLFVWLHKRVMIDANQWAFIYISNRDSGLIDQSNSAVIAKALKPFTQGENVPVVAERHSH